MHPTLGRLAINLIFLLAFLDLLALLLIRPGEAEFYVAILGLAILSIFLAFFSFEIRREAKEAVPRRPP